MASGLGKATMKFSCWVTRLGEDAPLEVKNSGMTAMEPDELGITGTRCQESEASGSRCSAMGGQWSVQFA